MSIKILIADDHGVLREGLSALLEKIEGIEVVGQAENGRVAVKLSQKHKPDIVIMDINMPDLNGTEATRQIKAEFPDIKIIAFSMYSDISYVTGMLKAGANGYLLKSNLFDELVNAVYAVVSGRHYMSEEISDEVLKNYIHMVSTDNSDQINVLSPREREVLQLIAEGHKTLTIAEYLNVSIKTVESHRKNIMNKLNKFSVAELTKFAIREGVTTLEQ